MRARSTGSGTYSRKDGDRRRQKDKEDKSERGTGAAVTINMENGKTEDMTEGVSEGKQFSLAEG